MKKTRRIIAGVAALTMAISMSVSTAVFTASAEVVPTTISCNADDTHTYEGYQIFVGNVQTVRGEQLIMPDADLEFGTGVNPIEFCVALGLDGTEGKEQTPANALAALSALDADTIVARLSRNGVLADSGDAITDAGTPFLTGYVYVKETDPEDTSVKGAILKIAQGQPLTVTPKASKPKVEKKVKEDDRDVSLGNVMDPSLYGNENKYNDCADYCIGEEVPFEVVGSMPANIDKYAHYYYEFKDRLGRGFKTPTDFVVTVNGDTVPSSAYELTVTPETGETTGETTISIKFDDIKTAVPGITAASKVVVTYKAILDDDANTTLSGNTNEVYLTYSNDTEYDGNGITDEDEHDTTDDTSKDGVAVFTYSTELYKVAAVTDDIIDEGAYFVLLDENNVPGTVNTQNGTVTWADEALQDIGTLDENSDYRFELTPGFRIKGLDSGTYKLVEVKAPDGYVKLTDPVTFTISADDLNSDGTWDWVNDYTDDARSAWNNSKPVIENANNIDLDFNNSGDYFEGAIENVEGINLPETGGIGTKIFYGVGGAAVLTSGVILVAKKRAKKED